MRRARWLLAESGILAITILLVLIAVPRLSWPGAQIAGHLGEPNNRVEVLDKRGSAPSERDNARMVCDPGGGPALRSLTRYPSSYCGIEL